MRITTLVIAAAASVGHAIEHAGHDGFDHQHIISFGSAAINVIDSYASTHDGGNSHFDGHPTIDPEEYTHLLDLYDPWGEQFGEYDTDDVHLTYAYILYALE